MRNRNEMEINQVNQLELGIAGRRSRGLARQRRVQRANWWFTQMRRVVDRAIAWPPPPARPEQVHLVLASRRN
ncbi:MAG TPA: hypothetical protein VN765_05640 [Candidatus Acidoferrum sp.]|nr:hypothetical protein [Candidatus Acidoferrum sp.]